MLPLTDLMIRFPTLLEGGGAKTAQRMIELAYRDGIRALCHVSRLSCNASKGDVPNRKDLLSYAEGYPDLRIFSAAELFFSSEEQIRALSSDPPTLGHSDILLISTDVNIPSDAVFRALMRLWESGHGVLLHAPDTVACFQRQPSLALRLSELGILFQISADSVLGENGLVRKRFCTRLLKENAVFSIVSDATDHLYRPPRLSKCYERIRRSYGEALAYRLFSHNPSCVLGIAAPLEAARLNPFS